MNDRIGDVASVSNSVNHSFQVSSAFVSVHSFTGIIFPKPDILIFSHSFRDVYLFDILPTAPFKKIVDFATYTQLCIKDLTYEIFMIVISSLIFYFAGLVLFMLNSKKLIQRNN